MIKDLLGKKILISDGAMGTMLQKYGLKTGELPEALNITHPEMIEKVHREYVDAGSDFVSTNTFGAFADKLEKYGYTVSEIVTAAVKIARNAVGENRYVALDLGSSGKLMEPVGDLTLEDAYALFKEQVIAGEKAGADFILFETFTDIYEMKAAVLAAKENTNLPVFCSVTFEPNGRLLMGSDPLTAISILQDMGIDALGVNCSLGPRELKELVREFTIYSKIPVLVQPNAGLPYVENGQTLYDISSDEYVDAMMEMVEMGVAIVGGCCGTTPEYIAKLAAKVKGKEVVQREVRLLTTACSSTKTVVIGDGITVIGERINPTGKKLLKEALKTQDFSYIDNEAVQQVEAGADILDINVGLPEIDEYAMMMQAVKRVSSIVTAPLQIDSSDPIVIEGAVRRYNGKAMINSVNGKASNMAEIFPIVKKYGASVIALTLDENGLPETMEDRIRIAEKIIETAETYGIGKERIIVDCLTLTVSAQQSAARETLDAIKLLKEKHGVKTTLGASNISFGLPERKRINQTFLAMAFEAGLDAPITDPLEPSYMDTVRSFSVLNGYDVDSKEYIRCYGGESLQSKQVVPEQERDLKSIIIDGYEDLAAAAAEKLLETEAPLSIVEEIVIPALEIVGDGFEKGKRFLPQLIKSADTVKAAFEVIKKKMAQEGAQVSYGTIVMATVKGDIHDIGKNITKVLLENYGYEVVDLGKDVEIETVVAAAKEHNVKMVGLSALMTTTVANMEETIKAIRASGHVCKIAVGGAVLTAEYAEKIDADYYCKDAMESVKAANQIFRGKE